MACHVVKGGLGPHFLIYLEWQHMTCWELFGRPWVVGAAVLKEAPFTPAPDATVPAMLEGVRAGGVWLTIVAIVPCFSAQLAPRSAAWKFA